MNRWFSSNPDLFAAVRQAVDQHLPTLHLVVDDGAVFLRGSLAITEPESNAVLSRYQIELEFPANYPKTDPIVRETGGAIPKTPARHFNHDGTACLFLPDARFRSCPSNCTIEQFVNGPVRAFFLWQTHLDITGTVPPSGEWMHGVAGIVQFYFEELSTNDIRTVVRFVELLAAKKVKAPQRCFCGSGKKLRDCHLSMVKGYRDKIPRQIARNSLNTIKKELHRPQE